MCMYTCEHVYVNMYEYTRIYIDIMSGALHAVAS